MHCISTWLEGRAKTCPLCCREVSYPTVIAIDSQKSALRRQLGLPTGWDELEDMVKEMISLKRQIYWMNVGYKITRDRDTALRRVAHIRKLDEMLTLSFQRRLGVLRGTDPGFWRDMRIWQQKEECRRIVGMDPDNANAIARGFRGIEGFDVPEPRLRRVKTTSYWLFYICLTFIGFLSIVGWIQSLERATRPSEHEWPTYSHADSASRASAVQPRGSVCYTGLVDFDCLSVTHGRVILYKDEEFDGMEEIPE